MNDRASEARPTERLASGTARLTGVDARADGGVTGAAVRAGNSVLPTDARRARPVAVALTLARPLERTPALGRA